MRERGGRRLMPEATASTKSNVIAPHGGELIDRTVSGDEAAALAAEAESLPRVRMSDKQTADLDMIASGALSPLTGFMNRADYDASVEDMHLANGLPWAMPVRFRCPMIRPLTGSRWRAPKERSWPCSTW